MILREHKISFVGFVGASRELVEPLAADQLGPLDDRLKAAGVALAGLSIGQQARLTAHFWYSYDHGQDRVAQYMIPVVIQAVADEADRMAGMRNHGAYEVPNAFEVARGDFEANKFYRCSGTEVDRKGVTSTTWMPHQFVPDWAAYVRDHPQVVAYQEQEFRPRSGSRRNTQAE